MLGDLIDAHFASQIGQKELKTPETERLHRRHFERVIGRDKPVKGFTAADVQGYITARSPDVKPQTVRKVVATLRMLLYRADRLVGEKPADVREAFRALDFATGEEKPGFMTWTEIEAQIARTKPNDAGRKELWDRMFLDTAQVKEFLDFADEGADRQPVPFMPVLLTATARTGARLSELCRSQAEDWDFDRGVGVLREKKKS